MRNIITYLKKFGNVSFEEKPFNEVDSLILSQLAYLNLECFIPNVDARKEAISFTSFLTDQNINALCDETLDERRNKLLLKQLKKTTRYLGLYMNDYQNHFNVDKIEQFCAVTYLFPDFDYIAYRGTDLTLLGWKENFNMALMDVIPSQEDAALYLQRVCSKRNKKIYIGGHSKGGNLAVYAALDLPLAIRNRIIKIFDHDGPGFQTNIFSKREYTEIIEKIEKTTCKTAMIGILLYHTEKLKFVNARGVFIFQHDPYNWEVTKDGSFKLIKQANFVSRAFEKTVQDFIDRTTIEEKRELINTFFDLVMDSPKDTIFDIKRHPFMFTSSIKKKFKKLSIDKQNHFKRMVKHYRALWRENFKLCIQRKI